MLWSSGIGSVKVIKSAMCDSCGLGKKNRKKPYREEKSITVPEHFLHTQHCINAGAAVYSFHRTLLPNLSHCGKQKTMKFTTAY